MTMRLKAWNIKQAKQAYLEDLSLCNTEFERGNCKAFYGTHLQQIVKGQAGDRKFTPGEIAILEGDLPNWKNISLQENPCYPLLVVLLLNLVKQYRAPRFRGER